MTAPASCLERAGDSPMRMASWRRWLFNRLARWEEASLARSLGLPVERVIFVDVRHTARRSAGLRAPAATRASDPS
jgi:hypothetical protein